MSSTDSLFQKPLKEELFEVALDYFDTGKYDQAENILNQIILKTPTANSFHLLGAISYEKGLFQKALKAFKKALKLDPDHIESSIGLSIILNDFGNYEKGSEVFDKAHKKLQLEKPENQQLTHQLVEHHNKLFELYKSLHEYEDCLYHLKKIKNLVPDQSKSSISTQIVSCLIKLEQFSDALSEAKILLKNQPESVQILFQTAKLHFQLDQLEEAENLLDIALNLDPHHTEAFQLLCDVDEAIINQKKLSQQQKELNLNA